MSNLEREPQEATAGGAVETTAGPVRQLLPGHEVALGGVRAMTVTRTLPNRSRRMVGAWCFADAYGPTNLTEHPGMRVPPHPHTALQTVSWLVAGEVLHHDSLGNEQLVRPGELNLMTAGHGISHSEQTPPEHSQVLHGVQLWVALPGDQRDAEPQFDHHGDLPVHSAGGVEVTVVMGEMGSARSPARCYTPLFCGDAALAAGAATRLPLRPDFEYAALALSGTIDVDGVELAPGPLLYLGIGASELAVAAGDRGQPGRLLLIGGRPFEERLVMWWNFVGRSHEEIAQARADWSAGIDESASGERRFGAVNGYDGPPLPAPGLPTTHLLPRGRER